jgi:DNA-binding YbaB/EbfC family protein
MNFGGNMGGMNLQQMMKQAQKMKEQMEEAQEELEDAEITASSGGGMVTATVNGKKELLSIKIKPEAVDPSDTEMLEDLIMAAVNEANEKAQKLYDEKMGAFGGLL